MLHLCTKEERKNKLHDKNATLKRVINSSAIWPRYEIDSADASVVSLLSLFYCFPLLVDAYGGGGGDE